MASPSPPTVPGNADNHRWVTWRIFIILLAVIAAFSAEYLADPFSPTVLLSHTRPIAVLETDTQLIFESAAESSNRTITPKSQEDNTATASHQHHGSVPEWREKKPMAIVAGKPTTKGDSHEHQVGESGGEREEKTAGSSTTTQTHQSTVAATIGHEQQQQQQEEEEEKKKKKEEKRKQEEEEEKKKEEKRKQEEEEKRKPIVKSKSSKITAPKPSSILPPKAPKEASPQGKAHKKGAPSAKVAKDAFPQEKIAEKLTLQDEAPKKAKDNGMRADDQKGSLPRCTYEMLRANQSMLQWHPIVGSTDPEKTVRLGAEGCRLEHTGEDHAAAARACLSRKTILFIGDSLTRFQYLSLANYIENGHWEDIMPRLAHRADWIDTDFDAKVTERLGGRETCDCNRRDPRYDEGEGKVVAFWDETLENRLYWRPEGNIRLAHMSWFPRKYDNLQGHRLHDLLKVSQDGQLVDPDQWMSDWSKFDNLPYEIHQNEALGEVGQLNTRVKVSPWKVVPGTYEYPSEESYYDLSLQEVLEEIVPHDYQPDFIVGLTAGFWRTFDGFQDADVIAKAAQAAVAPREGKVYFKTTTVTKSGRPIFDDSGPAKVMEESGVRIFDGHYLTTYLSEHADELEGCIHVDGKHFCTQINAAFNQVLLNMICNDDGDGK